MNEKDMYDKKISYWTEISFNCIKIYFNIIKKNDICCGHTSAKYLAKRVEGIPFLLKLIAYSEIIGCEKTKES